MLGLVACWAWLHLSSRRLRRRTIKLTQWPLLLPLYYAALLSVLWKPWRWRKGASVQEQRITIGARCVYLRRYPFVMSCSVSNSAVWDGRTGPREC